VDVAELLPVAPAVFAAAFVVTAVSASLQGTIGFGFAVLSVPVLSLLDARLAPVPQLLLAVPLVAAMLWRERKAVELEGAGIIVVARIPGAAIGLVLLKLLSTRALDLLLGAFVLCAVAILASGATVRRTTATKVTAGVASGILGMVSSIGGPPLALLYRDARGDTMRATLAAIFSIGLLITVTMRALAREISWLDVRVTLWLLPALLGGFIASRWLRGRVEGRPLRVTVLLVAALAAVGLLVRAALG